MDKAMFGKYECEVDLNHLASNIECFYVCIHVYLLVKDTDLLLHTFLGGFSYKGLVQRLVIQLKAIQ